MASYCLGGNFQSSRASHSISGPADESISSKSCCQPSKHAGIGMDLLLPPTFRTFLTQHAASVIHTPLRGNLLSQIHIQQFANFRIRLGYSFGVPLCHASLTVANVRPHQSRMRLARLRIDGYGISEISDRSFIFFLRKLKFASNQQ